MSQKNSKLDSSSFKVYGPIPRTIGTLVTVLVVVTSFGVVGWRQLQTSRALSSDSFTQVANNNVPLSSDHYVIPTRPPVVAARPANFNSRLIFFGILIVCTTALLFLLRLWT